ncbi:MAG: four helix bundle protein [Phycisphaerae bacterium]|nr:four helix bundle protein [Phycisphaerae bacterium]
MEKKKSIRTFYDLDVYHSAYQAMLNVFKFVLPNLPEVEKYDLADQLRRSTKAVPRLIAEGHSKRHQKRGFQKYLDDAMAESNETIVSLNQAKDLYAVAPQKCEELIDIYDKISRQCYNLALAWDKFNERKAGIRSLDEIRNEPRNLKTKDATVSLL